MIILSENYRHHFLFTVQPYFEQLLVCVCIFGERKYAKKAVSKMLMKLTIVERNQDL
jgi:hypothetical protein